MATITEADTRLADARSEQLLRRTPTASAAFYDKERGRVVVRLSTGLELMFAPSDAQGLERAGPADLETIEISPTGLGLHFPTIDADLYLPGLLAGLFGSESWMAERSGEKGKVRDEKAAARESATDGGPPKKAAAL